MGVMIGLPCGGGNISEKTTVGLFNLAKVFVRNNIPHGLLTLSKSSLIGHARSRVANFFLNNTEFEYLFFLDSDIGFDANDVLKLLQYQVHIVSAAYPMKVLPPRYCVNVSYPEKRKGDLIKIDGNGMGFVLIHRRVFMDMARQYPGLKYTPSDHHSEEPHSEAEMNNSYHYFAELKQGNGFMSEDKAFFHRATQVGYDTWLDPTIKLNHTGYHIY